MPLGFQVSLQMISAFVYLVTVIMRTRIAFPAMYSVDMAPQVFRIAEARAAMRALILLGPVPVMGDFVVAEELSASEPRSRKQCEIIP